MIYFSLSSNYRDIVSCMPFQPYRLWLMKMLRCPDSPAMYVHLEVGIRTEKKKKT